MDREQALPINIIAEQLLHANSIEKKLWMPKGILKESISTPSLLPNEPGRPPLVQFGKGRIPFPSSASMAEDRNRGIALLFFANHELLAIELMSLFILRFPNTPWKLRRGVMHIISEEQEHLHQYLQRAKELGVQVGDVPVNRFFWDSLHNMRTPEEFLSAMSLTFEQANLDHCVYYQRVFSQHQDHKSAQIMASIYQDELRHVRHGPAVLP